MIQIEAVLDKECVLRRCEASGHAGAGKTGSDIVCAAVSVLMRTAYSVLSGREGITLRGDAPEKGNFWFESDYKSAGKDFLYSAGVFLIEGLKSVACEYPENCRLNISILTEDK